MSSNTVSARDGESIPEDLKAALAGILEQVQVYASTWSLMGGRFDFGDKREQAEEEKAELSRLIVEAFVSERERCKAIYDDQTGYQLEEFMKALEETDRWRGHVGSLLGLIKRAFLSEIDRDTFDQIDGEYEAKCLEIKESAAECREIFERAKANADNIIVAGES